VSASAEWSAGAELDLGLLRRGRWFGGLPPALQQSAVRRSEVRSYSKGARIVAGGVPSRGLFALLRRLQDRGLVEVAFRRIRVLGPGPLRQGSPAGDDVRDSRLSVGRIAPGAAAFDLADS
jgi:hypothetical protein